MPISYDDYVEVRNTAGFDKYYTVGESRMQGFDVVFKNHCYLYILKCVVSLCVNWYCV